MRGPTDGIGCGLVFSVAFGFGCSAFAVVSFVLNFASRLVLFLSFARDLDFGRARGFRFIW